MIRRLAFSILLAGALNAAQSNKLIIILLGAPGAGKTTHANTLKKELKLPVISSEQLIRESNDFRRGELKKIRGTALETGEGLDDTILNSLIRQRVMRGDCANGFILDGFPRSGQQAVELKRMAETMGIASTVVIHLKADDETIRKRMLSRGRAYDKPEMIEERIRAYRAEEAGVLAEVDKSKLVEIDGTGPREQTIGLIREAIARFR